MRRIAMLLLAALLFPPSAVRSADAPAPQDPPQPSATVQPKKLDINRATLAELVAVPGVGPAMAQAIVDLRAKKGSFVRIDELLEVRGIKEKKLSTLSAYLVVAQPKAAGQTASAVPPK